MGVGGTTYHGETGWNRNNTGKPVESDDETAPIVGGTGTQHSVGSATDRYGTLALLHGFAASVHLTSIIVILILVAGCSTNTTELLSLYTPVRQWDSIRLSFVPQFNTLLLQQQQQPHASGATGSHINTTTAVLLNTTIISAPMNITVREQINATVQAENITTTLGVRYTPEDGSFSPFYMVLYILCVSFSASFASVILTSCRYFEYYVMDTSTEEKSFYCEPDHWVARIRWLEYTATAPIMIWLIAYYSGITDPYMLSTLTCITAITMSMGYSLVVLEQHYVASFDQVQTFHAVVSTVILCVAWFLQILVWFIIVWSFASTTTTTDPPEFVWAIFVLELAMFAGFGVIQTCWTCTMANGVAYKSMPWTEYAYPVMSITSKTFLIWMLYGFVLRKGC
jgi:hypothetical protein